MDRFWSIFTIRFSQSNIELPSNLQSLGNEECVLRTFGEYVLLYLWKMPGKEDL